MYESTITDSWEHFIEITLAKFDGFKRRAFRVTIFFRNIDLYRRQSKSLPSRPN